MANLYNYHEKVIFQKQGIPPLEGNLVSDINDPIRTDNEIFIVDKREALRKANVHNVDNFGNFTNMRREILSGIGRLHEDS
jgi:hypothetical protein